MSDLLPCPFCGGEAGKIVDATRILGTFNLIHRCPIIGGVEIKRATQEGVIARWNTRAPTQAQIDAAVKAERERCAERFANHDFIRMNQYVMGWRHDVYSAIRNGDQP
jgi:hypothetical protein